MKITIYGIKRNLLFKKVNDEIIVVEDQDQKHTFSGLFLEVEGNEAFLNPFDEGSKKVARVLEECGYIQKIQTSPYCLYTRFKLSRSFLAGVR